MQSKQIQFNPSLSSLEKQAEELISNTRIDPQGREIRWYSPLVFNHIYGKMIVDEIVAMLQELKFEYDADEGYEYSAAVSTAMQMIRKRFG